MLNKMLPGLDSQYLKSDITHPEEMGFFFLHFTWMNLAGLRVGNNYYALVKALECALPFSFFLCHSQ